jgi:hypothetical protein
MTTIHKYRLVSTDMPQSIRLPQGAKIVFFGAAEGVEFALWAIVDVPAEAIETRKFMIRGTGRAIEANEVYVGTVIRKPYVWHCFEVV